MRRYLAWIVLFLCTCLPDYCQWKEPPATGSPMNNLPDRTTLADQSGLAPRINAILLDECENARNHKAVVQAQTDGVQMVEPAAAHFQPKLDEAHIRYQLDNNRAQDSTAKTWTFDNLSSGEHQIRVYLVSNDNHELRKGKTLIVTVP